MDTINQAAATLCMNMPISEGIAHVDLQLAVATVRAAGQVKSFCEKQCINRLPRVRECGMSKNAGAR